MLFRSELRPEVSAPLALAQLSLPLVQALLRFEREGLAPFMAGFAARDLLRDRLVSTTRADVPEGIARGVGDDGSLSLETARGRVQLHSGEVSVRPRGSAPDGGTEPAC